MSKHAGQIYRDKQKQEQFQTSTQTTTETNTSYLNQFTLNYLEISIFSVKSRRCC